MTPKLWNSACGIGRGAFYLRLRLNAGSSDRRCQATDAGADRKANVGMSNDKYDEKSYHRKSKGS